MSDDGTLTEEGILPDIAGQRCLCLVYCCRGRGCPLAVTSSLCPSLTSSGDCRTRGAHPALLVFVLLRRMRLHKFLFIYFCLCHECHSKYMQQPIQPGGRLHR